MINTFLLLQQRFNIGHLPSFSRSKFEACSKLFANSKLSPLPTLSLLFTPLSMKTPLLKHHSLSPASLATKIPPTQSVPLIFWDFQISRVLPPNLSTPTCSNAIGQFASMGAQTCIIYKPWVLCCAGYPRDNRFRVRRTLKG